MLDYNNIRQFKNTFFSNRTQDSQVAKYHLSTRLSVEKNANLKGRIRQRFAIAFSRDKKEKLEFSAAATFFAG